MFNISDFSTSLSSAVDKQDAESMKAVSDALYDHILGLEDDLEESIFQIILEFMQKPKFQNMEGAWQLLFVFKSGWEWLSDDQRQRLLPVLEETYPLYTDWMSCFTISGLLGEFYCDEQALIALSRLARAEAEMPRSFVPHGLEHIVAGSSNVQLSNNALQLLSEMKGDASERVRNEVERSLGHLAQEGL